VGSERPAGYGGANAMAASDQNAALEAVELAAVRDWFVAAPRATAAALGIGFLEIGGALCGAVMALPGARTFNRVAGLGLAHDAEDEQLDAIAAFYDGLRLPYVISLAPGARPADLGERLERRGYEPDYAWVKFARPVAPLAPAETELRIERIGPAHAEDFARVVSGGFGLPDTMAPWVAALVGRPGWSCHLAFDGEEPAAAGALFVDGDVGWLGLGATLPEHRRRGAQGALLGDRIAAAAEAGCRTVATETGAEVDGMPSNSYRNILRSGFEAVYERPNLRHADRPA
jgi:GNAT superfamily N-acetyltransferase